MRSSRPPRHSAVLLALLMILPAALPVSAGELRLPDLVLPAGSRPDISQPDYYAVPGGDWTASPLRFRRKYPLAGIVSIDTVIIPVSMDGTSPSFALADQEEPSAPGTGQADQKYRIGFSAGLDYDLQEGAALYFRTLLSEKDSLEAEGFLPLAITPERVYSAGLSWSHRGDLSATVRSGARFGGGTEAYGILDFNWVRPAMSPDSYSAVIYGIGSADGGITGRIGTDLAFEGEGRWSGGGSAGVAGWYGGNASWDADMALWGGYRFEDARLSIRAGVHGLLRGDLTFMVAPHMELIWRPAGIIVYAETGLVHDAPDADVLILEDYGSLDQEYPAYARYSAGMILGKEGGVVFRTEIDAGYGRYAMGSIGDISVEEDIHAGMEIDLTIPVGVPSIVLNGEYRRYFEISGNIWYAETALVGRIAAFRLFGGSEDRLFGAGVPGIRGELPIIGLGADWIPHDGWLLGIRAYTGLPWDSPSVAVSLDWRS